MKRKMKRDEVVQRLTELGVHPTRHPFVLQKLGLAESGYVDGGRVVDPELVGGTEDSPVPGNLNKTGQLPEAESCLTRLAHIPTYFWHYLRDNKAVPREIPITDLDTSTLKLAKFKDIEKILNAGKPGNYPINTKQSIQTDFPESYYLGHLDHFLIGRLSIGNSGQYSFTGTLTAGPDLYNMNPLPNRTPVAEAATTAGRTLGSTLGHQRFPVTVKGSKPFTESGQLPLPMLTRQAAF